MKILFTRDIVGQDYQLDTLFHGLRQTYGNQIVDEPKLWYMYADTFANDKNKSNLYGKGFTVYGTLENTVVDRSHIKEKILENYFDFVVVPWFKPGDLANIAISNLSPEKIIWIDGADEPTIRSNISGHYFKRELTSEYAKIHPINFGFPKEKISAKKSKTQILANLIPGNQATYIYDNENAYYDEYNRSLFGLTLKKGGWDCMRHYEIIGSRSVPWFINVEHCPPNICKSLPKDLMIYTNKLIQRYGINGFMQGELRQLYDSLNDAIFNHFQLHCTTIALAKYVIETAKSHAPIKT